MTERKSEAGFRRHMGLRRPLLRPHHLPNPIPEQVRFLRPSMGSRGAGRWFRKAPGFSSQGPGERRKNDIDSATGV